jgi:hypothetical protein
MRQSRKHLSAAIATAARAASWGVRIHTDRWRVSMTAAAAAVICVGLAASPVPAQAAARLGLHAEPWLGLNSGTGGTPTELASAAHPAQAEPDHPAGAVFRTVDVPGANGTEVNAVNDYRVLAGTYFTDQGADMFGFIDAGTRLITLNYPHTSGVTLASAIDDRGDVLGLYTDGTGPAHAWIRSPNGTFTQIDDPQAASGPGLGTVPNAINDDGVTVGYYEDANNVGHAYIDNHGRFKTIDAPGAGTMSGQGTSFDSITDTGVISGFYIDANGVSHGFI